MRNLSRILSSMFLFLVLMPFASGQEKRNVMDLEYIRSTTPWLDSRNAAGLGELPVDRIATAEARFDKHNGGLMAIEESDNSMETGVSTEAFVRASDRLTLYGKLSYSYFNGNDMGGPILMDPSYNPINFYESVDTTVGIKNRELYRLVGGLSYSLGDKWSIGAKIDYESGDQAKLKDPRFLNVWMDLSASGGFMFRPSDAFSLGFDLEYERTLESLNGDQYGTTDKQYFTLVDYGGFYGSRELFEGSLAFVGVGSVRPMFNVFYGASLQIQAGRNVKVFNELTFLRRGGYYGKRSYNTITYTEHSGNIFQYNGHLLAGKGRNRHIVDLGLRYEGLTNFENIYRMNTELGEYTVVEYFGQNEILSRNDFTASLAYTGYLGVDDYRPEWEYGVRVNGNSRISTTTIYPFYRISRLTEYDLSLFGTRNIKAADRNIVTIGVEGMVSGGFGNPKEDGIYVNSTSTLPRSADLYLDKDFEYKTALNAGGALRFRYTRLFKKNLSMFVEARDSYNHLLKKPEYLSGNFRNIFEIKIGCTF